MKDYLFKYELKDAWNMPLRGIVISNDNNGILFGCGKKEKNISINIDNINSILNKYIDELESIDLFELPSPGVLDGYTSSFSFKLNDKLYNYDYDNLGFYDDETINSNNNLTTIFNFIKELKEELIKNNEEIEKYFVLTYEEDEEEIIKKKIYKKYYNKKTKETGMVIDIKFNKELNKYMYLFEDDEIGDINLYPEEDLEEIKED